MSCKNIHDVEVNSYTAVPPKGSSVTNQAFSQYKAHSPKSYVEIALAIANQVSKCHVQFLQSS